MTILGIYGGHDANWCVVRDGAILGAFEKERFSRIRHDEGEVVPLLNTTLDRLGLDISQIDLVATSEPVHRGVGSGLRVLSGSKYRRPEEWSHHIVEVLGDIKPCVSVPHHLAHAAYARYTSTFADTAVISWDGGGDFYTEDAYCSTSISSWSGSKLLWLERILNSDFGSLWFTYARAIFGSGNASGKLMGLAALGDDSLVDAFSNRFLAPVRGPFSGSTTVKNCWPDYEDPPFVSRGASWRDTSAQNAAYAIQQLTNYAGLSIAKKARSVTGHECLALSGGVSLNGYLTTKLRREAGFTDTFVPPAVNDGGISLGCALFVSHHVMEIPWSGRRSESLAFLGLSYGDSEIADALRSSGLASRKMDLEEALPFAASQIAEGKTIAWFEGRSEHGPRALGSRSILSLAAAPSFRNHLNSSIKLREEFRPTAPVVLDVEATRFFDLEAPSEYMMYIVEGNADARREIPAALHVDGTARIQTVSAATVMGRLLSEIKKLTGTGAILNTSFNVRTPIVETPTDAITTFLSVPLDYMYINGYWVRRQ